MALPEGLKAGSKATWKLDASLDEIIEADPGELWQHAGGDRGGRSKFKGGGGKGGSKGERVNYWDAEMGWSYRPPPVPPPPGGKGGKGWVQGGFWMEDWSAGGGWRGGSGAEDYDSNDGWKWKGEGASDSTGGWRDSGYGARRQKAGDGWTAAGDAWSSASTWSGAAWQSKAGGDDWTSGWSWSDSSADGRRNWGGGGPADGGWGSSASGAAARGGGAPWPETEQAPLARSAMKGVDTAEPSSASGRGGGAGYASELAGGTSHRAVSGPYAGAAVRKQRLVDAPASAVPPQGQWTRVRVTNIPDKLPPQDICDAFEAATGRILRFEVLSLGTAVITFSDPRHAARAADTFDRGELNGNIIEVKLVP